VTALVVGYNAYDVVVPIAGWPEHDAKVAVADIVIGGGGPGATAAVGLARLGCAVRLVTVFGDDEGSATQRRELAEAGVDCRHSQTVPGGVTPRAVILVDRARETRTIFWTRGDLPHLDPRSVAAAWLDGCTLLYCDGHEPAASLELAAAARALGLPVVYDAGSVREGSQGLVAACTDVISSRRFAPDLTGHADPQRALRAMWDLGPSRVAMTFGEAGVLALAEDGRGMTHVPAFAVPVVDTTGAGDAFHAGYAFARMRGDAWLEALEFGAAVAALKCRDWGGRRGLPGAQEAERLRRHGARRTEVPG